VGIPGVCVCVLVAGEEPDEDLATWRSRPAAALAQSSPARRVRERERGRARGERDKKGKTAG
jgi:hypothetical protein